MTSPTESVQAPSDNAPKPGELKIKERRSWKTWQLLIAVLVAAVFGMWINGDTGGASSTNGASTTSGTLPPPSAATSGSSAGGSTVTTTTAGGGSSVTTTTAAGVSTTTSAVAGSTTTSTPSSAAAAGPAHVLLLSPQQHGNWTSATFTTTAAPWNIGWAFNCAPAPATGPSFQVSVTPAGSAPSGTPAISETGSSGQSVTAQSSLGAQTLVVQTTASCTWIVKVTGS
jgi:hypothetical protein